MWVVFSHVLFFNGRAPNNRAIRKCPSFFYRFLHAFLIFTSLILFWSQFMERKVPIFFLYFVFSQLLIKLKVYKNPLATVYFYYTYKKLIIEHSDLNIEYICNHILNWYAHKKLHQSTGKFSVKFCCVMCFIYSDPSDGALVSYWLRL